MQSWKYWFGINPYLFEITSTESVDVDSEDDFRHAQLLYAASKTQQQ
jgi:CMP-N-acetylneuraminic acid synthetase